MESRDLRDLLEKARRGNPEAVQQIVLMLDPVLRKHSRTVGDEDAYSELVEWLLRAIERYPGLPSDRSKHSLETT